jgi:alanyl-tRNA synthetase
METIRIYDTKPYDTTFSARVVSAIPAKTAGALNVILDRTLFFPEEGGQTPDRGQLSGREVLDVQIDKANVITHTIALLPNESAKAAIADLTSQTEVTGTIDWAYRYSNMQNHSGEHILSGLLHSLYGYENVGFRLSDNTVTLDTSGPLSDEQILDLEQRANDVIYRNVAITCSYPTEEVLKTLDYRSKKELSGAIRIVTIEGVDVCACCAPHVARTGEIGIIKITGVVRSKASTRLSLVCGRRALADYEAKQEQLLAISHLTNLPQEDTAEGVERLLGDITRLRENLRAAKERYVDARLSAIQSAAAADASIPKRGNGDPDLSDRSVWVFEAAMDNLTQRRFMNALCDQGYLYAGVFAGNDTDGWKYLIGSRGGNANLPNGILKERFQARGGGKPEMVQGSVAAAQADIEAALAAVQ